MTVAQRGGDASGAGRSWMPAAAALVTGVAGGATLIISQRHLGLEAMAPLAQLWTIWAVLAAGLTFSFQQWAAIHSVGLGALVQPAHRRIGAVVAGLAAAVGLVSLVWRTQLFHSSSWVWPVAAAALPIGTAWSGLARGVLARRRSIRRLAAVIAGENVLRLAATIALVVVGAAPGWFAPVILVGFLVVVLAAGSQPGVQVAAPGGALTASAAAGFLAYAFMFGSPILLSFAGGDAEDVAVLFLVLTGVRVPFVVLQAVVPGLAASLAASAHDATAIAAVRRRIALAGVVGSCGAAAVAWPFGDVVIGGVFGIRGEMGHGTYAALAAASVLAACALIATVVLVVQGRTSRIALAWGVAALSGVVVVAIGLIDETAALSLWLVAAHASVVVLALLPASDGNAASPVQGVSAP